jgi:hypothetical protein
MTKTLRVLVVLAMVALTVACTREAPLPVSPSSTNRIEFPNYVGTFQLPTRSSLDFTLTEPGTPSLPLGGGTLEKTPTTWRLVTSNQPGGPYIIAVDWNRGGNSTVTFRVVD